MQLFLFQLICVPPFAQISVNEIITVARLSLFRPFPFSRAHNAKKKLKSSRQHKTILKDKRGLDEISLALSWLLQNNYNYNTELSSVSRAIKWQNFRGSDTYFSYDRKQLNFELCVQWTPCNKAEECTLHLSPPLGAPPTCFNPKRTARRWLRADVDDLNYGKA